MKPLKIALIHRDHPRHMDHRMIGMWSYDVPCLDVTRFPQPREFVLSRDDFADFDAIVWEDARTIGTIEGDAPIPVVYMVGDSTLSEDAYEHRFTMSRQADLILVDWDRLERFEDEGLTVRRLPYCVNERLFYPRDKRIDVGFYASITDERRDVHEWLVQFCGRRGYTYAGGRRENTAYCEGIGQARVNVNLNRNPDTRAHRCYDVMASQSCLLTSPMPRVSGETWQGGVHYIEWHDLDGLARALDMALRFPTWEITATNAYQYVMGRHTWTSRAQQLHATISAFLAERVISVH